jgi:hypothetical protein
VYRAYELWRRQNIFKKAAPVLLTAGVGLLSPSIWEIVVTKSLASYDAMDSLKTESSTDFGAFVGGFLVLSAVAFYVISHFCKVDEAKEFIFDKKIYGPFLIGKSRVYCYSGSVTQISDIDVVVTSEDTDLNLGGLSRTSVSGRIRHMAATHGVSGVLSDNLSDWIQSWKKSVGKFSEFSLGTVVPLNEAFCAASWGIKAIIFAVALRKNPSRVGSIDKAAIDKIVDSSIRFTIANGYKSIFIPVFGLGSGNVPAKIAIDYTLTSVCGYLKSGGYDLDLYIGVYTFPDTMSVTTNLGKWV